MEFYSLCPVLLSSTGGERTVNYLLSTMPMNTAKFMLASNKLEDAIDVVKLLAFGTYTAHYEASRWLRLRSYLCFDLLSSSQQI